MRILLLSLTILTLWAGYAQAQLSALGHWEFDITRKDVYINAVRANQIDTTSMSEIAAQMGMAKVQNTLYEFGADPKGAYLGIFDKTSNERVVYYISVKLINGVLHITDRAAGHKFRLTPVDNDHINLHDEQKNQVIPLRRI